MNVADAASEPAAARFDPPFDRLAALPRTLWLPGVTTSAGAVEPRLADLRRWRDALDGGELPDVDADFGDAQACAPLREVCGALGLTALCRGAPALGEQVLRTLLWHLDRLIDLQPAKSRADAIAQVSDEFRAAWTVEKGDWEEVLALLQGLGELARLSHDELRGQLARREWREAQRVAEHLSRMPELAALIRRLGRSERALKPRPTPPPPAATARERRFGVRAVQTRLPGVPGELRGVRLSDRIEGMLGSEAAMLLHPVLHKLWRAKRAEARLLTYDTQAVVVDLRPDPGAPARHGPAPPEPEALERGPIIVCLDTSGSMRGAPETVAKAVALAALRCAHAQRRGCLLIAFGGPGEVIERELGLDAAGLAALLDLMGQSFDGGTDLQTPIEHATRRVLDARWASADLLLVSDGEFGCTRSTLARLDDARERLGLRVQAVLVGDRETIGLLEVADDIFWVRDWRRHAAGGGARAFSPVHSKSLTALYFPNALSVRAARRRP